MVPANKNFSVNKSEIMRFFRGLGPEYMPFSNQNIGLLVS